jgi:hypothetical protein
MSTINQPINRFVLVSLFCSKLYKLILIYPNIDNEGSDEFRRSIIKENKGGMKSKRKKNAKRIVSF